LLTVFEVLVHHGIEDVVEQRISHHGGPGRREGGGERERERQRERERERESERMPH
jgi:hypothetical protein